MKRIFAVSVAALAITSAIAAPAGDTAAVNVLVHRQADAWNAHDIKAYSGLFTADAHVVNVLGWHWTSQSELEQKLGRAFSSVFAQSHMKIEATDVSFLKPDIAIAHVRWSMTGALSPTGTGNDAPQQGIQTQVLVRHRGVWKVADVQNTNSVPERPFPASH